MHSVYFIVPCVVVACKGLFLKSHWGTRSSTSFYSLPTMFWIYASFQSVQLYFFPFSLISRLYCCCTDLELSLWCMVSLEKMFLWKSMKAVYEVFPDIGGWYCSGNILKYEGWYSFLSYVKNRFIFAELIIELAALAGKTFWVGGDKNIFMSIYFADGLGFGVAP